MNEPIIFTKELVIEKLLEICDPGWVQSGRTGNHGSIGNTLEDLLGITENNLPIPNAAEWELKAQRLGSSSLTTLFHMEPSPRGLRLVSSLLLPKYGWDHQDAGGKYSIKELSFRQTINGLESSDRGFVVKVDRNERKVVISFDKTKVSTRHAAWLDSVEKRVGLNELQPQPYWGFDDLEHKAGTKLLNCFYVQAEEKEEKGIKFFKYEKVMKLQGLNFENFLIALEQGDLLVDFDARTGHNHGTKFRLRQNCLPKLYADTEVIR